MSHKCACGKPTDATLCNDCTRHARKQLRDLAWVWPELEATITRQTRIGDRTHGKSADTPVYFDEKASAARVDTEVVLESWSAVFQVTAGPVSIMCHRLESAWRTWHKHEAGQEFHDEILRLRRRVWGSVDIARWRYPKIEGGICPQPTTTGTCGGQIFGRVPYYPDDPWAAYTVQCATCGHAWEGTEMLRLGHELRRGA